LGAVEKGYKYEFLPLCHLEIPIYRDWDTLWFNELGLTTKVH